MIDYENLEMEREMSIKKLFEETITISIEKYDDLLKKAGRLEMIEEADKKKAEAMEKIVEKIKEMKEDKDAEVFEEEVIDE